MHFRCLLLYKQGEHQKWVPSEENSVGVGHGGTGPVGGAAVGAAGSFIFCDVGNLFIQGGDVCLQLCSVRGRGFGLANIRMPLVEGSDESLQGVMSGDNDLLARSANPVLCK